MEVSYERITFVRMNVEKRLNKGYKVKPVFYKKAMSRAKKEKGKLANLLENVVIAYAYGLDIKAISLKPGNGTAIDIFSEEFSERIEAIRKTK